MARLFGNDVAFAQRAIAQGATSPDPGVAGVVVWSTTAGALLVWTGAAWQPLAAGGGGGGGTWTSAQLNVPWHVNGSLSHEEVIAAPGVAAGQRVAVVIRSHTDDDENSEELLPPAVLAGFTNTDQVVIRAEFAEMVSGPIKIMYQIAS